MMASFRAKSARGKRSGDGREAGGRRSRLERAASIPPGRSTGEGMQAVAWSATSFEKLNKAKDANNDSSSTSPETDPGTSSVFPFFTGMFYDPRPHLAHKTGGRSKFQQSDCFFSPRHNPQRCLYLFRQDAAPHGTKRNGITIGSKWCLCLGVFIYSFPRGDVHVLYFTRSY